MFKAFFSKFKNSKGLIPHLKAEGFKIAKGSRLLGAGFTLIEILVTASLIVFVASVVIKNFSAPRFNLERVANVLASDLRLAQQLALSSKQFKSEVDPVPRNRCGYGITNKPNDSSDPNNDRKYQIYAGPPTIKPNGSPGNCSGSTEYQQNLDYPYYKTVILDQRIDFVTAPRFDDVFYKPPGPTTFIGVSSSPSNLADPTTYYKTIAIKKVGVTKQDCDDGSPDCIFICVYYSGRVEVAKNTTNPIKCPAPY